MISEILFNAGHSMILWFHIHSRFNGHWWTHHSGIFLILSGTDTWIPHKFVPQFMFSVICSLICLKPLHHNFTRFSLFLLDINENVRNIPSLVIQVLWAFWLYILLGFLSFKTDEIFHTCSRSMISAETVL